MAHQQRGNILTGQSINNGHWAELGWPINNKENMLAG
jgi:hypothetical protein